ncbi:LMBRD2_3 [Blepharisma stoltei]|uniref:LMBR1 domain-containing protein 2 n=1 Tax=Blepharisma stoltei TaxID=1481888 RepID=A0AAU9JWZ0_9CILI|nr:unnamed protein product [Blepharisma stoltei]
MLNFLTGSLLVLSFYYGWLIVYSHASKRTTFCVGFIVFISYFLGFTIITLIPYDIYLRYTRNKVGSPHDDIAVMRPLWVWLYWISFALGWLVLPLIKEYIDSGDFSFSSKLRTAFYRLTKSMILVFGLGLALVIYLLMQNHFIFETLSIFFIILNNCTGLFMIIILLGFGLVNVPQLFWKLGNTEKYLKDLYSQATILEQQLLQSNKNLDETLKLMIAASHQIPDASPLKPCLDMILSRCPEEKIEENRSFVSEETRNQFGNLPEKRLSEINYDIKKEIDELERVKYKYNSLIEKAMFLEDITNSYNSTQKKVISYMIPQRGGSYIKVKEFFEWIWLTRFRPIVYRLLGILFAIMSVCVVLEEITIWHNKPILIFRFPMERDLGVYWIQAIIFIPLIYIIACTYFAFSNIKLENFYGLYAHNNTDPSNLIWNASMMLKLVTPLSYNFYMFMKFKKCEFFQIMRAANFVPILGKDFGMYFPSLLLILCLLNYFNLYEKMIVALRIRQLSFTDKYSADRILEGASIIQNEREAREKDFGLSSSSAIEIVNNDMQKTEGFDENPKKFDRLYD